MIKFTKRTKTNSETIQNKKFRLSNERIKVINYLIGDVGVSLIRKPLPLTNQIEIVIGKYSPKHTKNAYQSYLFTQVNQHIKIKIPCHSPLDPTFVASTLQDFCKNKLRRYFSHDCVSYDIQTMCRDLQCEPDIMVINCAAQDKQLRKKIVYHAMTNNLAVLTKEQLKLIPPFENRRAQSHLSSSSDLKAPYQTPHFETYGSALNNVSNINFDITFEIYHNSRSYTISTPKRNESHLSLTVIELKFNPLFANKEWCVQLTNKRNKEHAFISWKIKECNDFKLQEQRILMAVKESFSASFTPNGYFMRTPFVRKENDKFVAGFDGELIARIPEANVNSIAQLSIHSQPASFIIEALHQLGYIKANEAKESETHQQNVYALSSGHKIVAVHSKAARLNKWGARSPLLWIVKNGQERSNSSGLIKKFIEMGAIQSHKLTSKTDAVKAITDEVMALITKNKRFKIDHAMNDGAKTTLKVFPPLPYKVSVTNEIVDFAEYMRARGITPKVISKVMNSGMIYPSENIFKKKSVSVLATTDFDRLDSMIAQRFEYNRQGKIDKRFDKGAPTGGSAHVLKGSRERYIILGEATMDLYALLSLLDQAGKDIEKYSIHSLMSATYVPIWVENVFHIRLPKDNERGFASLVNHIEKEKTQEELNTLVQSFLGSYEKIVFIDDGTPRSQQALKVFNAFVSMANISTDKIEFKFSPNRQTHYQPTDKVVIFDKTNLMKSLKESGITLKATGELKLTENRKELVPIVTDEQKAEAKRRIEKRTKGAEFILGFDNDVAGHSKACILHNFFKSVGIISQPFIVPFESKIGDDFSHTQVINEVNACNTIINLPFNERTLLNDINDYLLKLNAASFKKKAQMVQSIKAQLTNLEDSDQRMKEAMKLATLLHNQKIQIKKQYRYIFDIVEQIKSSQKDYPQVKKNSSLLRAYNEQLKKLRGELEEMISNPSLSDSVRYFIIMDKSVASVWQYTQKPRIRPNKVTKNR